LHAWVSVRFGGHAHGPGSMEPGNLCDSLVQKLRHALAESVINLGDAVVWPAGVRLEMRIQELDGAVDYLYEPQYLMRWAKAELERA
jgi:hypothetical protein